MRPTAVDVQGKGEANLMLYSTSFRVVLAPLITLVVACSGNAQAQSEPRGVVMCYPATDDASHMRLANAPTPHEQVVVIELQRDTLTAIPADDRWMLTHDRFVFRGHQYFLGPHGLRANTEPNAVRRATMAPIGVIDGATIYAWLPFEKTPQALFVRVGDECLIQQFWHESRVRN